MTQNSNGRAVATVLPAMQVENKAVFLGIIYGMQLVERGVVQVPESSLKITEKGLLQRGQNELVNSI